MATSLPERGGTILELFATCKAIFNPNLFNKALQEKMTLYAIYYLSHFLTRCAHDNGKVFYLTYTHHSDPSYKRIETINSLKNLRLGFLADKYNYFERINNNGNVSYVQKEFF